MKCKDVQQELIFYIDNELPVEKMELVRKHLKECADCSSFLAELRTDLEIIESEKNPEVSPFFFTHLSARLEESTAYQPQSSWVRLAQPAFFTIILLAGIYGGLRLGSNASNVPVNPTEANVSQFVNDFQAEPIESFLLDKL